MQIIDNKFLPHELNNQGRVLLAATGLGLHWRGVSIYANFHGVEKLVSEINEPSVMGTCITPLADLHEFLLDRKSKLIVNIISGELTSATEDEFDCGKNIALLGDEIIQFRYAKLVASNQYELSHIVRAKFGSPKATATPGHRFVLLDHTVQSVTIPHEYIGRKIDFKFISNGHPYDMAEQTSLVYNAECLKPLSPVHIRCKINGKQALINWTRRARINGSWRDGVDVPIGEENERYLVEVYVLDKLIIRQEVTQPEATLTLDDPSTNTLKIKVWQISSVAGLGKCAESSFLLG